MKSEYYSILFNALKNGDIKRLTSVDGKETALMQNGRVIFSTGGELGEDSKEEMIKAEPHLVVFGAGHVSKALYDMSELLSMAFTVIDEREETANKTRFPNAEIIRMKYEDFFKEDREFFRPYFVIMTHGHAYDKEALMWAINKPFSYLGMIGSKGKVSQTFNSLINDGYSEEKIKEVHAPIGLKIGAVTPEEIAVSILGEIISVFRTTKNTVTFSKDYLSSVQNKKGVVARIIEKTGSAPRSVGSELFYSIEEDKFYGTVGGGRIEKETELKCKRMAENKEKSKIISYNLSAKGDLNMICGGDVTMLYTSIE